MQNEVVILRSVLNVKFTKYCTCARGKSGEDGELSWKWTEFSYHIGARPLYARRICKEKEAS